MSTQGLPGTSYELAPGIGLESAHAEEALRQQALYAVAFFARHLLGERGYDRCLGAGYANTEPAILF